MSKSSEEARKYQVEWAAKFQDIEDNDRRLEWEAMNELFLSIEHENYVDDTQQPRGN